MKSKFIKDNWSLALCIILGVGVCFSVFFVASAQNQSSENNPVPTIILDPGHGA